MGEASYILGIEIYRDRSTKMLGLNQSSYIEKVLKRFKMKNSKREQLPMRYGIKFSRNNLPKTDEALKRMLDILYTSVVGSIQYVVQCTKPNIAYSLSVTSRYQACAGETHWSAVKTIHPTTGAEYIADSEAAKEAVWMKNYIQELGMLPSIVEPMVIFCDNNRAIAQVKEPRSHHRSKHILRCYHLLREMVSRGDIRMDQVRPAENTTDPLTKPMS
ncbi:UNVERIFIED_CONTAM: Retrovirus-related Pol polyprotein from transposon TNT 1-94 [Sesamum angustifolium]|uniref:Retrovirus-related Pol polyprotein from transposon TNT 1-94 n=1 Tax=Sesamum angustifolium TaxID=2727405 RepID=A0AAW2QSS9_9LAMI